MIILGSLFLVWDFVRYLKEKVINILETILDKLWNQMVAETLWTQTNQTKERNHWIDESSEEAEFENLQRATTDSTWGAGISDEKSPSWGLAICIREENIPIR